MRNPESQLEQKRWRDKKDLFRQEEIKRAQPHLDAFYDLLVFAKETGHKLLFSRRETKSFYLITRVDKEQDGCGQCGASWPGLFFEGQSYHNEFESDNDFKTSFPFDSYLQTQMPCFCDHLRLHKKRPTKKNSKGYLTRDEFLWNGDIRGRRHCLIKEYVRLSNFKVQISPL